MKCWDPALGLTHTGQALHPAELCQMFSGLKSHAGCQKWEGQQAPSREDKGTCMKDEGSVVSTAPGSLAVS